MRTQTRGLHLMVRLSADFLNHLNAPHPLKSPAMTLPIPHEMSCSAFSIKLSTAPRRAKGQGKGVQVQVMRTLSFLAGSKTVQFACPK